MIKKILITGLKVGMYVHDLNCGWMDHPFARSRFKINDQKTLLKVQALNIKSLYIDTEKGLDLAGAPSRETANREQQAVVDRLARTTSVKQPVRKSFQEEVGNGVEVLRQANQVIAEMMRDAQTGSKLTSDSAGQIVERMTRSLIRNPDVLPALTQIRDTDQYTFEHSVGACALMVAFCHYLDIDAQTIYSIGIGALLHDIGKVKIPDAILNKPGRLSDDEFKVMRSHVVHSKRILAQCDGIDSTAMAVAAEHHERYDGSGYPNGLLGEQMSRYSQIASIIDVYDAITSDRCYQKGLQPTEALRRLYEWSETQFNPELTQQFIRFIGVYPPGSIVELDSGHLALVLSKTDNPLKPQLRLVYDIKNSRMIPPKDIDLNDTDDQISGYAKVQKWGLSSQQLLKLML
ncbi:MAG: HD-GYP domain-containing protein [Halopseudomonas sp.]